MIKVPTLSKALKVINPRPEFLADRGTPDPNKPLLFRWEIRSRGGELGKPMTKSEIRLMLKLAHERFNCKIPTLEVDRENDIHCRFDYLSGVLWLPKSDNVWAYGTVSILHECSHSITFQKSLDEDRPIQPNHGPEFMEVYITLLIEVLSLNAGNIIKSMQELNIKIFN